MTGARVALTGDAISRDSAFYRLNELMTSESSDRHDANASELALLPNRAAWLLAVSPWPASSRACPAHDTALYSGLFPDGIGRVRL